METAKVDETDYWKAGVADLRGVGAGVVAGAVRGMGGSSAGAGGRGGGIKEGAEKSWEMVAANRTKHAQVFFR